MDLDILPVGDMALQIFYKRAATEELQGQIQKTAQLIENRKIEGVIEVVPSLQSITVYYNPIFTSYQDLSKKIRELSKETLLHETLSAKEVILIPTYYGGECGEDLERVASLHNLSTEEVIALHSSVDYLVYMIGFLPGFPYLKGLPAEISTPRLSNPRLAVPKGAVGIGGDQTGIYPLPSPGGWNLIGQTPLPLFDPHKKDPFLLRAGDYLRFKPITEAEFYDIESLVKDNSYHVERKVLHIEDH